MSLPEGWQTPKKDWSSSNAPTAPDFNRIESNIDAVENGNRTISQTSAPSNNSGTLRSLLGFLANRIKAILGTTNWYDAVPTTLSAAKNHVDNKSNPHDVKSQQINVVDTKLATAAGTTYPIGLSTFSVSNDESWPSPNGMVFTLFHSTWRCQQYFYPNQGNTVQTREWYNGTWSGWETIANRSYMSGFGLGGSAKDISGTNIDGIVSTGWYRGNNLINSPDGTTGFFMIEHVQLGTSNFMQMATKYGTSGFNTWVRVSASGAWTTWSQLARLDAVQAYKLTNDDGVVFNFSGDLNILTTPGRYYANGSATNKPENNTMLGLVVVDRLISSNGYYQELTNGAYGRKFVRYYSSGVWGSWFEYAQDDSLTRLLIYAGRGSNQAISASTMTRVSLSNIGGRQTGQWNGTRFTVPKSGVYTFNVGCNFLDLPQYAAAEVYIYKNGTSYRRLSKIVAPGVTSLSANGTLTISTAKDDYWEIYVYTTSATNLDPNTYLTIGQITP